jgi:hypothetical protein
MRDLETGTMCNAIKAIIFHCGIEVLSDANRFRAAIKDFMSGNSLTTERQLLDFSVRVGVGEVFLKAFGRSESDQKRAIVNARDLLTNEYGFLEQRSDNILAAFVTALGWDNKMLHNYSNKNSYSGQVQSNFFENTLNKEKFIKGGIISFGNYLWRVLYVDNNAALLLADEITDVGIPYNTIFESVSWETCSLRRWLNFEFLSRFTEGQQQRIMKRRILAEDNPWYQTSAGNQTEDKVFLLSILEVVQNMGDSGHLKIRPKNDWLDETIITESSSYAIDDRFNNARRATYKGEYTWWWLRSPGNTESKVAYVNADGILFVSGESAFDDGGTSCVGIRPGVRPVIWLQIEYNKFTHE